MRHETGIHWYSCRVIMSNTVMHMHDTTTHIITAAMLCIEGPRAFKAQSQYQFLPVGLKTFAWRRWQLNRFCWHLWLVAWWWPWPKHKCIFILGWFFFRKYHATSDSTKYHSHLLSLFCNISIHKSSIIIAVKSCFLFYMTTTNSCNIVYIALLSNKMLHHQFNKSLI